MNKIAVLLRPPKADPKPDCRPASPADPDRSG
jgi:hypothetical protein